jgi:hypothetical protein
MARKTTTRKKVTRATSAKRRTGKAAKKPRKAASATSQPAVPTTNEVSRAVDLLRGWSPSRYSTR